MLLVSLARMLVQRKWAVIAMAAAFTAAFGLYGSGAAGLLSTGGYQDHSSQSYRASGIVAKQLGLAAPSLVVLEQITGSSKSVTSPSVIKAGLALDRRLGAQAGVENVVSYWQLRKSDPLEARTLVSHNGRFVLMMAGMAGNQQATMNSATHLAHSLNGRVGPLSVRVGGTALVDAEITAKSKAGLARAELLAFPIVFVLLVVVFGGFLPALLPLIIGGVSVVATMAILRLIASVTAVSIFALNIATGLGLGLAIDYSLFILSRFREQRALNMEVGQAIEIALAKAGKTILYSAATVILSLATMAIFPLYFLQSLAYAGMAVVAMAAGSAIVILPALLGLLGKRLDRPSIFSRKKDRAFSVPSGTSSALSLPVDPAGLSDPSGSPTWNRVARFSMRRPLVLSLSIVVVLLALASPFRLVHFALPGPSVLPPQAPARQVSQTVSRQFGNSQAESIGIVSTSAASYKFPERVANYATNISKIASVAMVQSAAGVYIAGHLVGPPVVKFEKAGIGTYLVVSPKGSVVHGSTFLTAIKAMPAPFAVSFTGMAAQLHDTKAAIGSRLALAAALIGITTALLVLLFTGSVLLAVKAVVLGALSLSASFGAMVYIFQQGHLKWLVGPFTATGSLDTTTPILMFCMAFGLSMDYEIFLLSRICENYRASQNVAESVALGIATTGRLITAAASLVAIVFGLIGTSGVSFIKLMGIGMAVAVLMDATVVRALLVPAVMRLGGRASFWGPTWLLRINKKLLSEH